MSLPSVGTRVVVTFLDGSTNTGVVTDSALADKTMPEGHIAILFDGDDPDEDEYGYALQPDGTYFEYFEYNNQGDPVTITLEF